MTTYEAFENIAGVLMELRCDLHCHSGYAGGVGDISLSEIKAKMSLKGIEVVGTGDCLQKEWLRALKEDLIEVKEGLFASGPEDKIGYILQTEVIFTAKCGAGRKSVHHVLLFPSFESVERCRQTLSDWGVKLNIGRPFIKCVDRDDVADKLYEIHEIDPLIESIPAHVMTPTGIYGSKRPVVHMHEFYGEGVEHINAVETGLSADPVLLGQIPELDDYVLLSNSDAHSPKLHRMGREYTTLEVSGRSYPEMIKAIRNNDVLHTAEFNPTEGRYFLSGHRPGRMGHDDEYCIYSPKYTPMDGRCPVCGKKLTIGVLERSQILRREQGGEERDWGYRPRGSPDFVHMVPLVEVIGYTLGIKSPESKQVLETYYGIMDHLDNECRMWFTEEREIERRLSGNVSPEILENILEIKRGNFTFTPMGYDGTYGRLEVGERSDIFNVKEENISSRQAKLNGW